MDTNAKMTNKEIYELSMWCYRRRETTKWLYIIAAIILTLCVGLGLFMISNTVKGMLLISGTFEMATNAPCR